MNATKKKIDIHSGHSNYILGCPWKLVTIVVKLVYKLFRGPTTCLCSGYNPFTKYHGRPSTYRFATVFDG